MFEFCGQNDFVRKAHFSQIFIWSHTVSSRVIVLKIILQRQLVRLYPMVESKFPKKIHEEQKIGIHRPVF